MTFLNRVQLLGILSNSPEIKYSPKGEEIIHFSIVGDSDTSNIIPITAHGQLGKFCFQSLKEGSRIYLEGKLKISRFIEKSTRVFEGEEYDSEDEIIHVQVVANKIEILAASSEKQVGAMDFSGIDDELKEKLADRIAWAVLKLEDLSFMVNTKNEIDGLLQARQDLVQIVKALGGHPAVP